MEEINELKQKFSITNTNTNATNTNNANATLSSSSSSSTDQSEYQTQLNKLQEKHRTTIEKHDNKIKKLEKKQSKILFISFYILLNLAEDPTIERKMIKKGLIDYLLNALDRSSSDLLILAVTFLKKLSIYEENKNYFKTKGIILKLSKFLPCSSQSLMIITLRLIFNLSFDSEIREQCTQHGMIPKLINLLKTPLFRGTSLRLLYHLSIEDRCKSMFTYSDGIPLFMGMIINFPQNLLTKELAGLAVNVSINHRNAEIMASNRGLNHLVDRVLTTRDSLLMKIIRNISYWSFMNQQSLDNPELQYKYRGLWSPHIKNLCKLAVECDSHDLLIEILGTIANFTLLDLPMNQGWSKMLSDYNLLPLLSKLLVPGMSQNDVILEVVMILSAAASDNQSCKLFLNNNIIPTLYQVWKEKSNDLEVLLQLLFCFYKLLSNENTQEEVLYGTRIIADIIECLGHTNPAVRFISDQVVELVLEVDRNELTGELGQLGLQIRKKRFDSYNQKWLTEMIHMDEISPMNGSNLISGGGGGGNMLNDDSYHEDYIARQYVHDEQEDEDIAWRAVRSTSSSSQQQQLQYQQQQQQYSKNGPDSDYGYGRGNLSPGTLSSDGDGDDSWDGRRQYK